MTGRRTNVYSYDRGSQGEKDEEHNQMVDLPKLLRQLSLARVVLKRLPISTEATKLRFTDDHAPVDVAIVDQAVDVNVSDDEDVPPSEYIDDDEESHADSVAIGDTCDIVDDAEQKFADESTTTCDRKKFADLIKRSCPKCKRLVVDAKVKSEQLCTQCETPLSYQCARCDKRCNCYKSLVYHLSTKCDGQNLDLKCPKCNYQTHSNILMYKHEIYCSSRTIHSCSHCAFKTRDRSKFDVHMRIKHDDESTASSRTKPADLIKRICPKCKLQIVVARISKKQSCAKCDTPLSFQCARCDKQYNCYESLLYHLTTKCNAENLDMKCPKCNYQTRSKDLMYKHVTYCSSRTIHSCSHCAFKTRDRSKFDVHMRIKHEVADKSTTTHDSQKSYDLTKRYCQKCKLLIEVANVTITQSCANCESPLSYQCARCDKRYSHYRSLCAHLKEKCNVQNLDLKCPMCDFQTHAKSLMHKHLTQCISENNFSCDLCDYRTKLRKKLLRHMVIAHKDILKVDCSQCETKLNKCEQCKNKMHICETCRTGFSSTDSFQKHQKFCKPPVLECKYCPYQTINIGELRKHIKVEHMNGSMSQAYPVED